MKSNLVLTISIGDKHQKMSELTIPSIKKYADKIDADFLNVEVSKLTSTDWEKTQIYDLFHHYKRIIFLDVDLIIRDDCPNLFEIVPENELGIQRRKAFV